MKLILAKKEAETVGRLALLGDIGMWYDITSENVSLALAELGDVERIIVDLNSMGGEAHEGLGIMNLLRAHKASVEVHVLGFALSAASIIAMGADRIVMHGGSLMMIHNAATGLHGDAASMRKAAEILDKLSGELAGIYARRSGQPVEEIVAQMNEETWFTAAEAVEAGLADVAGSLTSRSISSPFAGQSTGSAIIGGYGLAFDLPLLLVPR